MKKRFALLVAAIGIHAVAQGADKLPPEGKYVGYDSNFAVCGINVHESSGSGMVAEVQNKAINDLGLSTMHRFTGANNQDTTTYSFQNMMSSNLVIRLYAFSGTRAFKYDIIDTTKIQDSIVSSCVLQGRLAE